MKRIIIILSILFLTGCGVSNSNNNQKYELYCEKGNLVNNKCEIIQTMDVEKKCREGYTFNEETSKCENTITIAAKKVSECPDGYFIGSDNWCLSEEEFPKETTVTCVSPNITPEDKFSTTYVTEGGVCVEKLCVKVAEDGASCLEFKESQLTINKKTACPSWTKEDDGVCRKKYWMNKEYSCELGEKQGNNCVIKDSIDKEPYCKEEGYKLNKDKTLCEKKTYNTPKEKVID